MSTFDTDYTPLDKIKSKERRLYMIFLAVVLISLVGAFLTSEKGWDLISVKGNLASNWNDVFLKYSFIIIAIERAAAVYVGITRSQEKKKWEKRIKRVREVLSLEKEKLSVSQLYTIFQREEQIITSFDNQKKDGKFLGIKAPELTIPAGKTVPSASQENLNELQAYLQATKSVYEFKAAVYQENTNAKLTRVVFLGGVIISAVGLSIFNDIFNASAIDKNGGIFSQYFFYRLNDIVVTGGLLGGGSKSFNVFIETLNKTFERIKEPKEAS